MSERIKPNWRVDRYRGAASFPFAIVAPYNDGLPGTAVLGAFAYKPHADLAAVAPAFRDALLRITKLAAECPHDSEVSGRTAELMAEVARDAIAAAEPDSVPGLFIPATYGDSFAVGITAEGLALFAQRWPCFGEQSNPPPLWRNAVLWFDFDRRGNLIEVNGDEGLDEGGVSALVEHAKAFAVAVYELPAHAVESAR